MSKNSTMPNRLAQESSPYLLQHANNPVDWYPWGDEALQKAQKENKLLLISIGYAACHWCHVMEKECFEDAEVAQLMNRHFVCIKVDREERPDIDKVYIEAVQLMRQHAGWPLNAFALSDGRPIYGGTYFPKEHWMQVLQQMAEVHRSNPERTHKFAEELVDAMKQVNPIVEVPAELAESGQKKPVLSQEDLHKLKSIWMDQIDFKWGGRKSSGNKFPLPTNNLFMLRTAHLLKDERMQVAADLTLEKMAYGGIYDHLGGGFARYSVDPYWKVPHFEKMLYDNGQLVSLYAEAWQQNPRPMYKAVVYDTIEFIKRELTSPEGGFYSSLDADSEGVEGKFYTWQYDEIEKLLGEDAKIFADYYNAHPFGNWEERNILFVLETETEFAQRWKLDPDDFAQKMAEGRKKLFEAREPRIRPGLDDKILTSWNALMLKGLVDAYRVFDEPSFLEMALKNAHFIRQNLTEGGKLYRNYKAGKHTINAFLDDYAYLIQAYIALYQVTFNESWIEQADQHMQFVHEHFANPASSMYFYTSDEEQVLVHRKTEIQDDVIPSSNSSLAHSLHQLGLILHKSEYLDLSAQMLRNVADQVINNPGWFSHWGLLGLTHIFKHYEVAITGPQAEDFRKKMAAAYFPNRLFAGAEKESHLPILQNRIGAETTVFVCHGNSCQLPVHTVEEALVQLKP